jgi:hypothetical protein
VTSRSAADGRFRGCFVPRAAGTKAAKSLTMGFGVGSTPFDPNSIITSGDGTTDVNLGGLNGSFAPTGDGGLGGSVTLDNPWSGGDGFFASGSTSNWGAFTAGGTNGAASVGVPGGLTDSQVVQAYRTNGPAAVGAPGSLAVINDGVTKFGDGQPVTQGEVNRIMANTDVKVLNQSDYATLKRAAGGQQGNAACEMTSDSRALLATDGPANLARSRLGLPAGATPPADAVAQAKADLMRIDPGAFKTPPKDAIYINQATDSGLRGNPNTTKIAAHELTHLVLDHHGVPDKDANGTDIQHQIIGQLGWNEAATTGVPGETSNFWTPPGQGIPPPPNP